MFFSQVEWCIYTDAGPFNISSASPAKQLISSKAARLIEHAALGAYEMAGEVNFVKPVKFSPVKPEDSLSPQVLTIFPVHLITSGRHRDIPGVVSFQQPGLEGSNSAFYISTREEAIGIMQDWIKHLNVQIEQLEK